MQKLARLLAGSAVLATVALSAPGAALAAQNDLMAAPAPAKWNMVDNIEGTVIPDGTWTLGNTNYEKTESNSSEVKYEPLNNVDGGMCMQLYELHSSTPLTGEVCQNGSEKMTLAPVPSGTDFFVKAKKRGAGSDNDWHGLITY